MNSEDDYPGATGAGGVATKVPPLTRRTQEGVLYRRSAEVSAQIETALELDRKRLLDWAAVADYTSEQYLRTESLVFLIRHFHAAGDEEIVGGLWGFLLGRCKSRIECKLPASLFRGGDGRTEAIDDVVGKMVDVIFDLKRDAADYYQVAFGDALNKLLLKAFRNAEMEQDREAMSVRISGTDGGEPDEDGEESRPRGATLVDSDARPDEQVLLVDAERALAPMKPNHRKAYRLRHFYGWSLKDIGDHFGKTPETIGNWLEHADEAVARWRRRKDS
jgi:hypothetical protein